MRSGIQADTGLFKDSWNAFSKIADYLDLVAVSIASDIVPLTGENRVLAYFGSETAK